MNHQDALRELSTERYLLGELTGEPRELFEEHLFDCPLCAADLQGGVTFLQAARIELAAPVPAMVPQPAQGRIKRLLSPAWLVPALAASLITIAYQSAVVLPSMRQQLAQADSPAVMNNLVLTGGATRDGALPHIIAPSHGSFLLSLDVPAESKYATYLCTLYSPSGTPVWHGSVTPQQANDTVLIRIPSAVTAAGANTLLVQGMRKDDSSGAKMVDLAKHTFLLELSQ